MTATDVNDFLNSQGGPPAFKFDNLGDIAKGVITNLTLSQARDFDTGKPKFYDDGNPIMQLVITLRQDDNEERRLFCKPQWKVAIRDAVSAAGAETIEVGGRLAVKWASEEPPKRAGMKPQKIVEAQYQAPTNAVSADDLLG